MTKIIEYKRTCNVCGKVWHSLASEEERLNKMIKWTNIGMVFELGNQSAFNQDQRNFDALMSQLNKIRKCPNCGSANCTKAITTFDR